MNDCTTLKEYNPSNNNTKLGKLGEQYLDEYLFDNDLFVEYEPYDLTPYKNARWDFVYLKKEIDFEEKYIFKTEKGENIIINKFYEDEDIKVAIEVKTNCLSKFDETYSIKKLTFDNFERYLKKDNINTLIYFVDYGLKKLYFASTSELIENKYKNGGNSEVHTWNGESYYKFKIDNFEDVGDIEDATVIKFRELSTVSENNRSYWVPIGEKKIEPIVEIQIEQIAEPNELTNPFDTDKEFIMASELYNWLGLASTNYSYWIKSIISNSNGRYIAIMNRPVNGGRETYDCELTRDDAKKIAMNANSPRKQEILKYFRETEKTLHKVVEIIPKTREQRIALALKEANDILQENQKLIEQKDAVIEEYIEDVKGKDKIIEELEPLAEAFRIALAQCPEHINFSDAYATFPFFDDDGKRILGRNDGYAHARKEKYLMKDNAPYSNFKQEPTLFFVRKLETINNKTFPITYFTKKGIDHFMRKYGKKELSNDGNL